MLRKSKGKVLVALALVAGMMVAMLPGGYGSITAKAEEDDEYKFAIMDASGKMVDASVSTIEACVGSGEDWGPIGDTISGESDDTKEYFHLRQITKADVEAAFAAGKHIKVFATIDDDYADENGVGLLTYDAESLKYSLSNSVSLEFETLAELNAYENHFVIFDLKEKQQARTYKFNVVCDLGDGQIENLEEATLRFYRALGYLDETTDKMVFTKKSLIKEVDYEGTPVAITLDEIGYLGWVNEEHAEVQFLVEYALPEREEGQAGYAVENHDGTYIFDSKYAEYPINFGSVDFLNDFFDKRDGVDDIGTQYIPEEEVYANHDKGVFVYSGIETYPDGREVEFFEGTIEEREDITVDAQVTLLTSKIAGKDLSGYEWPMVCFNGVKHGYSISAENVKKLRAAGFKTAAIRYDDLGTVTSVDVTLEKDGEIKPVCTTENVAKVTQALKAIGYTGNYFTTSVSGALTGTAQVHYTEKDNRFGLKWDESKGEFNKTLYIYALNEATGFFESQPFGFPDIDYNGREWNYQTYDYEANTYYVIVDQELPQVKTVKVDSSKATAEVTKEIVAGIKDFVKELKDKTKEEKESAVYAITVPEKAEITADVFTAAKEAGLSSGLALKSEDGKMAISFEDLDSIGLMSGSFNPATEIGKESENVTKAEKNYEIPKDTKKCNVNFTGYDGVLPGKANVTVDLTTGGFADGESVFLYLIDGEKATMKLVAESKMVDGTGTFKMDHFSEYTVLNKKIEGADGTVKKTDSKDTTTDTSTNKTTNTSSNTTTPATTATSPNTGDMSESTIVIWLLILMAGIVLVEYRRKSK